MWGIFEVFADTMIVCSMTALVVLTSGVIDLQTGVAVTTIDATLVADAFNTVFSFGGIEFGKMFIALAIFLFALTTVLGWSHYGTKAVEYLAGKKAPSVVLGYRILFVLMILSGALMTSSLAWDISDTFNGLMMLPNLIGVVTLSPIVIRITRNYVERVLHGKDIAPLLTYAPQADEKVSQSAEKK